MSQDDKVYKISEIQIAQLKQHLSDAKEALQSWTPILPEDHPAKQRTVSMLRLIGTLAEGIEEFLEE